jgi:hypothetical protein
MTIDDIALTTKGTIELERLKEDFNNRVNKSFEKKALLSREIKGYSLIFDNDKFPIRNLSDKDEPLIEYNIELCSMHIRLIREFYNHFIVDGHDISEIEINIWDPWYWELNEFAYEYLTDTRYFFDKAVVYKKYLKWLSRFKVMTNPELALIKVYQGEILKRDNSKLYQNWSHYSSKCNRLGAAETNIKNRNKVKLFERVVEGLFGEAKKKAENDLNTLKLNIKNQGFIT